MIIEIPCEQRLDKVKIIWKRVPVYTLLMFMVYVLLFYTLSKYQIRAIELDTDKSTQIYRWYSYSLVHLDNMHLWNNMIALLISGTLLEFNHSMYRVFLLHFFGVIFGALAVGWQVRMYGSHINLLGASGGVYALTTSQIANLILNWSELHIIQRISYSIFLSICILIDIIMGIVFYNSIVSYSNHIGGAIGGVLAGMLFLKNIKVIPWENKMKLAALIITVACFSSGSTNLLLLECT